MSVLTQFDLDFLDGQRLVEWQTYIDELKLIPGNHNDEITLYEQKIVEGNIILNKRWNNMQKKLKEMQINKAKKQKAYECAKQCEYRVIMEDLLNYDIDEYNYQFNC